MEREDFEKLFDLVWEGGASQATHMQLPLLDIGVFVVKLIKRGDPRGDALDFQWAKQVEVNGLRRSKNMAHCSQMKGTSECGYLGRSLRPLYKEPRHDRGERKGSVYRKRT